MPPHPDPEATPKSIELTGRGVTRRSFLARLSAGGIAASTAPLLHTISTAQVETSLAPPAVPPGISRPSPSFSTSMAAIIV